MAVNPVTNRVYVTNFDSHDVTVVNGATKGPTGTVAVGSAPTGLHVNVAANRIYVVDWASNLSAIGRTNNTVSTMVTVGSGPIGVAANEATGRIYAANFFAGTLSVIVE